jgi:hypothetical protein
MKTINARLKKLEKRFPPPLRRAQSPAPRIAAFLASRGFVRRENESLMEMTARAFGITSAQLRTYFQRRAAGQPGAADIKGRLTA